MYKDYQTSFLHTVAPKSVRTLMVFIKIGLYPLIKINISKCLFNNKIYNIFLTKWHKIFLKDIKKIYF